MANVLWVDDELTLINYVKERADKIGLYGVDYATSPEEADVLVRSSFPKRIITDLIFDNSNYDGIDIIDKARTVSKNIEAIVLTGKEVSKDHIERSSKIGGIRFFKKGNLTWEVMTDFLTYSKELKYVGDGQTGLSRISDIGEMRLRLDSFLQDTEFSKYNKNQLEINVLDMEGNFEKALVFLEKSVNDRVISRSRFEKISLYSTWLSMGLLTGCIAFCAFGKISIAVMNGIGALVLKFVTEIIRSREVSMNTRIDELQNKIFETRTCIALLGLSESLSEKAKEEVKVRLIFDMVKRNK